MLLLLLFLLLLLLFCLFFFCFCLFVCFCLLCPIRPFHVNSDFAKITFTLTRTEMIILLFMSENKRLAVAFMCERKIRRVTIISRYNNPCMILMFSNLTSVIWSAWNAWSRWTQCSITCGAGEQLRRRTCKESDDVRSPSCSGETVQIKECKKHKCPAPVAGKKRGNHIAVKHIS